MGQTKKAKSQVFGVIALFLAVLAVILSLFGVFNTPINVNAGYVKEFNFQGRLTNPDGTNVADGTYDMIFRIYNAPSDGIVLWKEYHTGGNKVTVEDGVFNVNLGSINEINLNFNSGVYYLGIEVNGDGEMTPRRRIGGTGYSLNTERVYGVPGSLTDTNIDTFPEAERGILDALNYLNTTAIPAAGMWADSGGNLHPKATVSQDVSIPDGRLHVSGAVSFDSTLGVTGATTLSSTLLVSGAASFSSTLGVTSTTTLSGTLNANGIVNLGDGGDTIAISGTSIGLTSNGANNITITSGGEIYFSDQRITTQIPFSLTDNTAAFEAAFPAADRGIVDALVSLAGGSAGLWNLTGTIIHPAVLTNDVAIGANSLVAPFSVDESLNTVRIGEGSGGTATNAILNMYASNDSTGAITYTTNDLWEFSGGNIFANGGLVGIGSGANGMPTTGRSLNIYNAANDGYGIYTALAGAGTSSIGQYVTVTGAAASNFGFYSTVSGASEGNFAGYFVSSLAATPTSPAYGVEIRVTSDGSAGFDQGALNVILGGDYSGGNPTYGVAAQNLATGSGLNIGGGFYSLGGGATNYGVYGSANAASATNAGGYFTATSAATTNYGIQTTASGATTNYGGSFSATGAHTTNYGIYATASGATNNWAGYFAGNVALGNTATTPELRLYEATGSGTNYTAFKATAQASDITYTLPSAVAGGSGYVLTGDATGALSWTAPGSLGVRWNEIAAPNGDLTLAMSTHATTFNWDTTSGNAFTLTGNSLTSGSLLNLTAASTAAAGSAQKVLNISTSGANGTAGQTTYGLYASNTHTGATSENVAGYFAASGGVAANYGVQSIVTGGAGSDYGIYATNTSGGAGNNYGALLNVSGTAASNDYGIYSEVGGTATNQYGIYQSVSGGTAANYGYYGAVSGGSVSMGAYTEVYGADTSIGIESYVSPTDDGTGYGGYFLVDNSAGASFNHYGVYSSIVGGLFVNETFHGETTLADAPGSETYGAYQLTVVGASNNHQYGFYSEISGSPAAEAGISTAVYGRNITTGSDDIESYGVQGIADSSGASSAYGVAGSATGGSDNYGGSFAAIDDGNETNYGIFVQAAGNVNVANYGIYSYATGDAPIIEAFHGEAELSAESDVYGGYLMTTIGSDGNDTQSGFYSVITGTHDAVGTTATTYAIQGINETTYGGSARVDGYGVYGSVTGANHYAYGVYGWATGSGNTWGVYASAAGSGSINYGVYGTASGATTNWAGYFVGNVALGGSATAPELRLYEATGSGTNYTAFKATAQAADITYTLPSAVAGGSGYVLTGDATGALSWSTTPSVTVPLSSITAATATNSINSANYAQTWAWNSLTTQTAMTMSSSSMTRGKILTISSASTAGITDRDTTLLYLERSGSNTNASHTAHGLYSVVANDGTTSTNIAGYFSAKSATTNWAGYFDEGNVYIKDNLGIGTVPSYALHVSESFGGAKIGDSLGVGSGNPTTGTALTVKNPYMTIGNPNYSIYAINEMTSSVASYAGYFEVNQASPINYAGYFTASGASQQNYAGYFDATVDGSYASEQTGVYMTTNVTAGSALGTKYSLKAVLTGTYTSSSLAAAISASNEAIAPNMVGINSRSASGTISNTGGRFLGQGSASQSIGVYASASGGTSNNYGIQVYAYGGAGTDYAGYFEAADTAMEYGIYATTIGTNANNYGGYFSATGAGTVNYGIYATASNGGTSNWAGYFVGDTYVSSGLGVGVAQTTDGYIQANARIGVGVSPSYQLHVSGDGYITSGLGVGVAQTTDGYIQANDRIGVAMTPSYPLDVTGAARISTNLAVNGVNPNASYGLYSYSTSTTGRAVMSRANATSGTNYAGYFQASGVGVAAVHYGLYSTASGGVTNWAGYFDAGDVYIANSVGLNTTGPDSRLDILDASNPQLRLTYTDGTSYTTFQSDSSGDLVINPYAGDEIIFGTSSPSNPIALIPAENNVSGYSIGTSAARWKAGYFVDGIVTGASSTTYAESSITRTTGGGLNVVLGGAAGDDFTVNTDTLVVESDHDRVGINKAAPGYALDVADATANGRGINVAQTGTGTTYGIYSSASGATTDYGGYFTASGTGTNYGIYATASGSSGDDDIAGYFTAANLDGKYVVHIINTENNSRSDVLALQLGYAGQPRAANAFIQFMDFSGAHTGAVVGDGAGGVKYSTTGEDYAEYFPSSADWPAGTVVKLGANGKLEQAVYGDEPLGVISSHPGFSGGQDIPGNRPLAMMGQVPVKITNEGGAIRPGDKVTVSSRTGFAKKVQAESDPILGVAVESFNGTEGQVKIFVSMLSGMLSATASADGSLINGGLIEGDLGISGELDVAGTIKASSLWSQNATWHIDSLGEAVFQKVTASDIEIIEGENKAIGRVTLPGLQKEIFVPNNSVTSVSRIFLTIESANDASAGVKVKEKRPGQGFVISTIDGKNAPVDLPVDWLIIN